MPLPGHDNEAKRRAAARDVCFAYLYERPGLALSLEAISNGVRHTGERYTPTELYIGLHFLVDAGFAEIKKTATSATERFEITAKGQLEYENSF